MNKEYSEIRMLRKIGVNIQQFGEGLFFGRSPEEKDLATAGKGLDEIAETFSQKNVDVLILDEINVAVSLGLVKENSFLELLKKRPLTMEVICTGRRAPEKLLEMADLITEMKAVRHYYKAGVQARTGIEK